MTRLCSTLFTLLLCFYFSVNLYGAESKQSGPTNPPVFSQQTKTNIRSLFCKAITFYGEHEFVKIAIEHKLIPRTSLNKKICGLGVKTFPLDEALSQYLDHIDQAKVIKLLLDSGAVNKDSKTSIEDKIYEKNFYMIKVFAAQGINLDLKKLLKINLKRNERKIVRKLLSMGYNPSEETIAASKMLAEIYSEQLKRINQGKEVSFSPKKYTEINTTIPKFTKKPRSYAFTLRLKKLIADSIEEDNDHIFKLLLKTKFIGINDIIYDETLLGIAIEKNKLTIAKDLISQKALLDKKGTTPLLHIAAKYSDQKTTRYLLKLGVNNDYFNRKTPLIRAILFKNFDVALILIEKNKHINSRSTDYTQITPLEQILKDGSQDQKQDQIIEALLKKGATFSPNPDLLRFPKAAKLAKKIVKKARKKTRKKTIHNTLNNTLANIPTEINKMI